MSKLSSEPAPGPEQSLPGHICTGRFVSGAEPEQSRAGMSDVPGVPDEMDQVDLDIKSGFSSIQGKYQERKFHLLLFS